MILSFRKCSSSGLSWEHREELKELVKDVKEYKRTDGLEWNEKKKKKHEQDRTRQLSYWVVWRHCIYFLTEWHITLNTAHWLWPMFSHFFFIAECYEFFLPSESFMSEELFPHSKVSNHLLSRTVLCFDCWGDEAATANCVSWNSTRMSGPVMAHKLH